MTVSRTTIKNALLALCATATFSPSINGFSTWATPPTRRLKLWGNVDKSNQPAMFLVQHHELYEQRASTGTPPRRYLICAAWCYAPSGDDATVGDDLLDTMEQALEAALEPPPSIRNDQTLGGLLEPNGWVRIDRTGGMLIRDPGDIDGQALLVLPIRILLP